MCNVYNEKKWGKGDITEETEVPNQESATEQLGEEENDK